MNLSPSKQETIDATRQWLEKAVIGLNLCPFAKSVHVKGQIRYFVSSAQTAEALHEDLVNELQHLRDADPGEIDTTLIIHPFVLDDFLDFNDFLDVAEVTLGELDLEGEIQIASFHPHYQFAGTEAGDMGNYTNRSPYPTLHLLREASLDRAVEAFPDAAEIFERNIETMHRLGREGWDALQVGAAPPPENKQD
jgi:uncharacterized protein